MKSNAGKVVLGVTIGALAGAIAGILFAPQSGKDTRKLISRKSKEYVDKGKKIVEKGVDIAKDKIKDAADDVSKKLES